MKKIKNFFIVALSLLAIMAETLAVASCEKIFNENFFSGLQSSHSISTENNSSEDESSEDSSHSSKPEDSSTSSSSSSTHTHRYTEEVTTPTCTEQGYTTYTCACGDSYIDNYLPATHTEVIDEAVAPSCTKTGLPEGKHCSVCSTILVAQETVNATGHSYVNSICDVCGEIKTSQGLHYSLNDDGVSYSLYNIGTCTDTDIVIPSKYEGLPVTNIYPYAFQNQAITSVIIPDSVTYIDGYAFYNCTNLTSIVIGGSVTKIGNNAFYNCNKLTNVYYKGTEDEWDLHDTNLSKATRYYYSETKPTAEGNYWYYNENGEIAVWENSNPTEE